MRDFWSVRFGSIADVCKLSGTKTASVFVHRVMPFPAHFYTKTVAAYSSPSHHRSPKGGRPRIDDRAALTGLLFVPKTGIRWK